MRIKLLSALLLLALTGCSSQPDVPDPVPPSYAIEQNAQGVFVVCQRPCRDGVQPREPVSVGAVVPDLDAAVSLISTLQEQGSVMPEKNISAAGMPLHLVQFEFSQSAVTAREAESLARFAEEMLVGPLSAGTGFVLRGYTDAIGPQAYNLRLAEKRVAAVAEKFTELGLPVLRTEALGACCFVATNDTDAGRAQNRRVEVFLLTEKNQESKP